MAESVVVTRGERKTLVITAQPVIYRHQLPGDPSLKVVDVPVEDGVLTYSVPTVPAGGQVLAYLNGVQTDTSVVGVNVTLLGYSPGEIAASDELRLVYTE